MGTGVTLKGSSHDNQANVPRTQAARLPQGLILPTKACKQSQRCAGGAWARLQQTRYKTRIADKEPAFSWSGDWKKTEIAAANIIAIYVDF